MKKPIDCDLIKNIMKNIDLSEPEWAYDSEKWKEKLKKLF